MTLRSGRFGPYVQLGEAVDGEKPKRAGLPKGTAPDDVDLDRALQLLSLPREVGRHPEDGEPIKAAIGRFGPYVQHGKTYANLEPGDDIFHIGLNRAVTLIAEKIAKGPRRRFGADPGRALGNASDQGRSDRGEERPLWALCQPRGRQRDAADRQDAGNDHAGRGSRTDRCARRALGSDGTVAAAGREAAIARHRPSRQSRIQTAGGAAAKRAPAGKPSRKSTQAAE